MSRIMSAIELLATSPALFIGMCMVLGLAVGSFLNVVIYRLPLMLDRQWREQCEEISSSPAPTAATDGAMIATSTAAAPAGTPERFNLVVPRSACPRCRAPITALQNIPLLSFVLLRGRCARCGAPISARYPVVEALTGVLSALVAWQFGFGWPALAAMLLTWFLVALT